MYANLLTKNISSCELSCSQRETNVHVHLFYTIYQQEHKYHVSVNNTTYGPGHPDIDIKILSISDWHWPIASTILCERLHEILLI